MKGISLSILRDDLYKISEEHESMPAGAIPHPMEKLTAETLEEIKEYYDDFVFLEHYRRLSLKSLEVFSFDELCKLKHASFFYMDKSVEDLFDTEPRYEVVRKIQNSMWCWGTREGTWNEVVDAYNNIRRFSFIDDPDFVVTLDHTISTNRFSRSKYANIYIDGVFAFLVYYKGEHVMTIGFSIMKDRQLLIQQVQLAKRSGNRFLYRLPSNRLEFIIQLFRKNFAGYELFVIDGKGLIQKMIRSYHVGLQEELTISEKCQHGIARSDGEMKTSYEKWFVDCGKRIEKVRDAIAHIEADAERVISFYKDVGRFKRGRKPLTLNGLAHYKIAA